MLQIFREDSRPVSELVVDDRRSMKLSGTAAAESYGLPKAEKMWKSRVTSICAFWRTPRIYTDLLEQ